MPIIKKVNKYIYIKYMKTRRKYRKRGGKTTTKIDKRKIKNNKTKTKPKASSTQFIKLNCSPENKGKEYTCYTDDDLIKLKNMWNARHPDKPIETNNSKEIWLLLKDYYSNICNKESCWLKQMTNGTKMESELLDSFAPESPIDWKKNPNEWLSSVDIVEVMNQ